MHCPHGTLGLAAHFASVIFGLHTQAWKPAVVAGLAARGWATGTENRNKLPGQFHRLSSTLNKGKFKTYEYVIEAASEMGGGGEEEEPAIGETPECQVRIFSGGWHCGTVSEATMCSAGIPHGRPSCSIFNPAPWEGSS